MKKIVLIAVSFCVSAFTFGQKNADVKVTSKIDDVKLFLSGAHVNRSSSVNLLAGTTTIVFTDLPNTLDASTYRVEGDGAFTIMSIKEGYSSGSGSLPKEAQILKDSITLLTIQKEDVEAQQQVLEEEENFLNQNRSIGGQQTGIKVAELKEAADFYKVRLSEIKKGLLTNRRKISEITQKIEKLKGRLYPFTSERVVLNQQLSVTVLAERPTKARLKVSYFTSAAGWTPLYDIRSTGPGSPVHLVLKASASNSTGENWTDVKFIFSTGSPAESADPPTIFPWYIRPIPVREVAESSYSHGRQAPKAAEQEVELLYMTEEMDVEAGSISDFTVVEDGVTAVDYSIPASFTLETGRDPLIVEIEKKELVADFEYHAIPKFIPKAYLMARIANADRLNLLPASASIYLNNAYTGSAYLSPLMATDTLNLPLGQDNSIIISRNRIKDYRAKNFIGSKVSESIGWEIEVRNMKSETVKLKITDQIPISADKSVKVETVDLTKGKLDTESGFVKWNIQLDSGKSQNLKLIYKVEYPKEIRLVLE